MKYPSIAEVVAADQEQVSVWWHFLSDPKTPAEERVLDLVFKKFQVSGGFIEPELAKRVRRASSEVTQAHKLARIRSFLRPPSADVYYLCQVR